MRELICQPLKSNILILIKRRCSGYNKDPKRAHPQLTECERASLAHVDPDVILGEEEFYFRHRGECPTMDEYRNAQPTSGYPIKLPLGLKKLRSHDDPETIRAFADILGSLMQPTDRPPVDHLKTHEYTSSLTINMLTMNHGNPTRNPKLDGREVHNMARKDRPIVKMLMQNSAHILCLNEADPFLTPQDGKIQRTHQDVHPIRVQGHRYQAMVIQTNCMLCPRRTFRKSGTIGKTHFHQESVLGNHIRDVQMFLRNRGKLH